MKPTKLLILIMVVALAVVSGCSRHNKARDHGVYMLLDTSGTYTEQLTDAQRIINYILSELEPGDTFAVARIDTGSFSGKDIVHRQTFDTRPSQANAQRRKFRETIDTFVKEVKPSSYTDITGGILQAIEHLNEVGPGNKTILIFSDMKEDLKEGYVRDIPLQLDGFNVVALNVIKLSSDNVDPRKYMNRLEAWQNRVESGGGQWKMVNDMERLESVMDFD
ncbi:MAG: VWA domain-containing protein [Thiohalophilus sp.]|uniref:VWA domain-containing protein n=1 Tax=Thiohalophilus sp. TaxID=3028392 RepID=UPI00287067BB|nr:VWA domain-containing protein [Thiohalophilus sp.]MDR9435750.1 VWA domain-containing protein [Thiohalophilus sp.]